MEEISPAGKKHEVFTAWAKEQGVKINAVGPARIRGRGLGIVATRKIQAGEELVKVPVHALLTIDSVRNDFRALHGDITVHGLLASFLAFSDPEKTSPYAAWRATWPTFKEFEDCMPILWPVEVTKDKHQDGEDGYNFYAFRALPPAIGGAWGSTRNFYIDWQGKTGLLHKQEEKLKKDWTTVRRVFPDAGIETYTHYWLIVNTRTFYFMPPGVKNEPPQADRMALCPFADYFNHADHGCDVTSDTSGFTITSDRIYEAGEEIYVSYGNHSNDFLLTEYGFILDENRWDSLPLDGPLLRQIHKSTQGRLNRAGYLGNYTLSREGVCYRTQVAVRTQTLGNKDWRKFIEGKENEMEEMRDESKADYFIAVRVLDGYADEATKALAGFAKYGSAFPEYPRSTLKKRWMQIAELVKEAYDNSINDLTREALGRFGGLGGLGAL
ncbi:SET domain [Lasallia pustulata]|uniref:SET domain n=1 Tax=Lasallia pustulata TaxID=136370 RepID=A0A1W5D617_9LECA|nr:SET domain [Lasallia pustulata]